MGTISGVNMNSGALFWFGAIVVVVAVFGYFIAVSGEKNADSESAKRDAQHSETMRAHIRANEILSRDYAGTGVEHAGALTNRALKERIRACAERMKAFEMLFEHHKNWPPAMRPYEPQAQYDARREAHMGREKGIDTQRQAAYLRELQPEAKVLADELFKRIPGIMRPTEGLDWMNMLVIDSGHLAGYQPLKQAAIYLEGLAAQLRE